MDTVIVIAIIALMVAMLMLLFTHSLVLQRFGIMEFFALLIVSACICFSYRDAKDIITTQYYTLISMQLGNIQSYMDELEEAGEVRNGALELYSGLDEALSSNVTGMEDNTDGPYISAALVQRDTQGEYAECYTVGENPLFWSERKTEGSALIESAMAAGAVKYRELGNQNILYAVTSANFITPQFAVVIEITPAEYQARLLAIRHRYIVYGSIFAAVIAVCYIVIILIQNKEIRNMIHIMRRVAEGKEDLKLLADRNMESKVRSNEMRMLYSGLRQIATDIMRVNYSKYKALQVYYRFAPKEIEKIMGKSSILDVEINEQVSIEATLAYISFNINERFEQHEQLYDINTYYTRLGEIRKQHNGIIFNSSTDLSTIQMMFNEEVREAVQFGIEMVSEEQEADNSGHVFVLLHRTTFIYGISGDDEQTFAFAHSMEMKEIERYVDRLRRMGIRMAVTDYVHEMLPEQTKCRYIGYIQEKEWKFNLYEILDAYPAKERQQRIDTCEKFDEALRLFYQSDFYFARTLFTEILKDCPQDNVAKHYIFQCESCLNEEKHGAERFSL